MRILAAMAALLLLSGCAGHGQVDALQQQAVAQWSRPGLREVGGFTNGPGRPLGMPRYAQVLRILEIDDGSDARSVVAEVHAVATRTGWSTTFEPDDSFTAEKTLTVDGEELRVELGAGRQTRPTEPGPVQVYLSLTAYPA